MKSKYISVMASMGLIFSLLTGCTLLPEPISLIRPPQQISAAGQTMNSTWKIAKSFLPARTHLSPPNDLVGSEAVLQSDLNQDGMNEIVAFYRSTIRADKVGAVILQKQNNEWEKVDDITGNGYDISWGSAVDVTGDGRPELLIGWNIGVSAGNVLDIYQWKTNKLKKVSDLHYHELDVLQVDHGHRLAVWKRESPEDYTIDVLKWNGQSFVSDQELYPSYFRVVGDYYMRRIKDVPDAPQYWYGYAHALFKADQPEDALKAIEQGMTLKNDSQTFQKFERLKKLAEKIVSNKKNLDVQRYIPEMNLSINLPRQLASNVTFDVREGEHFEYILDVYATDRFQKKFLFAIEAYPKEFIVREEIKFPVIRETEQLLYTVRREEIQNNFKSTELFNQLSAWTEGIISSVQLGPSFAQHSSLEDQLIMEKIIEAQTKIQHIHMGGKVKSVTVPSFLYKNMDYRYLGEDIQTRDKVYHYLSGVFTKEAIEAFINGARIIEKDGKLAQPNADGGSLLKYSDVSIVQMKDLGGERQYDLKVPVGNSLAYNIITVVFKKTDEGWRISSNPLSF